ncbi:hypothetical protein DdX_19491 [Ditylenchus destructor]|uniref:Uncharacterized protein n=1 Tax=Ditylenchus destructor TaxID=166010 RepID=A0AAD4QX34_9BILA|nr:hypothetical protein DdX_19491 [Ditylenchus destructor]
MQIVELKNVNVRPYWVDKSAKNITDSELELSYHDTNTRLTVIPVPEEDKPVLQDYDEERKFPPYWRYLENVMKPWEKYLAGHVVVLQAFEIHDFTYISYGKPVTKIGVYGVVGDPRLKKTPFFIETGLDGREEAKREFAYGVEFHFFEAESVFIGSSLWIKAKEEWCFPLSEGDCKAAKMNTDASAYKFIELKEGSTPVKPANVKRESSETKVAETPKRKRVI